MIASTCVTLSEFGERRTSSHYLYNCTFPTTRQVHLSTIDIMFVKYNRRGNPVYRIAIAIVL